MTQYDYDTVIEEMNNESERTVAKEKWGKKTLHKKPRNICCKYHTKVK